MSFKFGQLIENGIDCSFKLKKTLVLQPRNYQISKEAVHELEFGDLAVMQI